MAESCWRDDWDSVEAIQNEQIGVPGDNDISAAVDGQFEEFIVFWITARGDLRGNHNQLGIREYLA
jgi:hypothetical protein